jgi:hypothetical protein
MGEDEMAVMLRHGTLRHVLCVILALSAAPCTPSGAETPKVVGRIHVLRLDVFDPESLGALGTLGSIANALHVTTREGVVRDLLLVESGDTVTAETLEEAERTLRRSGLFRTAEIEAYGEGDTVDVVVTTRDVWSTQVIASYSTAGGDSELTLGGIETNFVGTGDVISGVYRFSDQANRASGRFVKRRFLGAQAFASIAYSDGDDGISRAASVTQPFYAIVAPWSGAVLGSAFRGNVWLYDLGDKTGRYRLRRDLVYGHLSLYRGDGARWRLGGSVMLDDRTTTARIGDARDLGSFRNDRRRQVTLAVSRLERRHVRLRDVDRAGVPEDHALGHRVSLLVGTELAALGSTHDRPYAEISTELSVRLARGVFGSVDLRAAGHLRGGELEGREAVAVIRVLGQRWRARTQAMRLLVHWGEGFSPEELLYLGARSGLRGFPSRAFRGDRAVLANLEERIETGLAPFGIGIGVAAFGDAGFVWERPEPVRARDIRADVGLGLRLTAPHTSLPLRIDVARGLGPDGAWQATLTAGQLFGLVRRLDFLPPLPIQFGSSLE